MLAGFPAIMPHTDGHQRGLLAGPSLAPPQHGMPDGQLAPFLASHHVLPPLGVPAHDGPLTTPALSGGLPGQFGSLLHAGLAALHGDISSL